MSIYYIYTYIQYINPLSRVICVGIHLSAVVPAWQWVSIDVFVLKSWITYRTMSDQHSFTASSRHSCAYEAIQLCISSFHT